MTPSDDHRERLRRKAGQHDDPVKNKKDNAKRSSGKFLFKDLDPTNDEKKKKKTNFKKSGIFKIGRATKKALSTRAGVALVTAALVSGVFYSQDIFSASKQQDNLDASAAGGHDDRIASNQIFPDPPAPKEDTLDPAHVGVVDHYIDPNKSMAIGDSTVAWANGEKKSSSLSGCGNELGTWPEQTGMHSLSCAGMTTREIASLVEKNKEKLDDIDTFFITAGSNDIRGDKVGDLDRGIEYLLDTITDIRPEAEVIFVGYLPAYLDQGCMSTKDRNSARRLYDYHRKANYAMQDSALRHGLGYIDVFHSPYRVCDSEQAFVRIPSHNTPGAKWHTTQAGHTRIAEGIKQYVGWENNLTTRQWVR